MKKKQQETFKKMLSFLMALALVIAGFSPLGALRVRAADSDDSSDENLLVHYDMTVQDGQLLDISGNERNATLNGELVSMQDGVKSILKFTGKQYISLPKGIVGADDAFTIRTTFQTSTRAWQWLYCLGAQVAKPGDNYLFIAPINADTGTVRCGIKKDGSEIVADQGKIDTTVYNTITTAVSDGNVTVYLNGQYISEINHDFSITGDDGILAKGADGDVIGYIGRSLWSGDPGYIGTVSDFKVYDSTLSAEEVKASYEADQQDEAKQIVASDKASLTLPDTIYQDYTLPSSGANGASIVWEVDENDAVKISSDGKTALVTRPQTDSVTANFTATISIDGQSDTKAFTVTIPAKGDTTVPDPTVEYNFDEDLDGCTVKDTAGGHDGTISGNPVYQQDEQYGQVLYLDGYVNAGGSDSYLEIPAAAFSKGGFTVSMDVNPITRTPLSDSLAQYSVFSLGDSSDKYLTLGVAPEAIHAAVKKGGGSEQVAAYQSLYPNNSRIWTNVTLSVADNQFVVYRNGVQVAVNSNTGVTLEDLLGADGLTGFLGKSPLGNKSFRGMYDDVKIFNSVLNPDQVEKLYSDSKEARETNNQSVAHAAASFSIPNQDDIRGNIYLPEEIDGVCVAWSADQSGVISTEEEDHKPAGVVTRGENDVSLTLKAVFSKEGSESVEKSYAVTVKAKPQEIQDSDYAGYLFVHFTGQEGSRTDEQTYFSLSKDGLNWVDLNKDKNGTAQPVLQSTIGESGLRDHFIARSPDGDKFYMIATDLSIYENKQWSEAGANGSHSIVVWESEDLINWSAPRLAEIAPKDAGCTWAPEFIYDDTTGEYVVYWSATTQETDAEGSVTQNYENHTIYSCETRDFVHFTPAAVYHAGGTDLSGKPIKVIDSTMIRAGKTYYRYTKNETEGKIMADKSSSILGDFEPIVSTTLSTDLPTAQGPVEGPIIFKMNQKDESGKDQWCLMADRYKRSLGYYPMITNNLDSGEFKLLNDSEFSMPSKYRHGYVLPITAQEYDRLQQEWGGKQRPGSEEKAPFFSENFENFSSDGVFALNGSVTVAKDAAHGSKALVLNGASGSYAALPAGWLDGLKQATVSFDVKSDLNDGNFFTLAIGQSNTKYMFFRARGKELYTAITTGSHDAESSMSASLTNSQVGTWMNVTLVFDGTKMYCYVDGKLAAKNENTGVSLTDLGADAKIWFGRSFYSRDVYFKGSYDNIKLFDYALTETQVSTLSASNAVNALEIQNSNQILGDFELPTLEGAAISWESSDEDTLRIDGNTAKLGKISENKTITLTASVTIDGETAKKQIPVTLIAESERLSLAAKALVIPYYVPADYTLPSSAMTASVTWDGSIAEPSDGIGAEQTLTATLSLGGKNQKKAFKIKPLRVGGHVISFTVASSKAVPGQENAMCIAVAKDRKTAKLNKGEPVLYSKYLYASGTLPALAYPSIFRKNDGKFGVAAVAETEAGSILLYDSDDLTSFTNERSLKLGSSAISRVNVQVTQDGTYLIYWKNSDGTYVTASDDLRTLGTTEKTAYPFANPDEDLPADAAEASSIALTSDEIARITARFGTIVNTGIASVPDVTIHKGETSKLPDRVTAQYNDGSTMQLGVVWDTGSVDLSKAGTYTVTGTVQQPAYTDPLIEERADPYIVYNEDDGYYYFTASYPQVGKNGVGYDRIVLRRATSVEGLKDAKEVEIWNQSSTANFNKWIWAPELHKIGGTWYILTTASPSSNVWSITPILIECSNPNDMLNPDSWEAPVRIKAVDGDNTFKKMSLDMTHFTANGKDYLIWADTSRGSSSLLIATIDPKDPSQLTSKATLITGPEYSWERYGIAVNEGPAVIKRDGKIYLAFSAASTGSEYCVGVMTADETADLLDVSSWTKSPLPIMTTADFTNGLSGPGHNSFTVDEYGNPLIIYHARPKEHLTNSDGTHGGDPLYDPCRHARVKTVHFAADGRLVLNMTPEEELAPAYKTVSVKVTVKGSSRSGSSRSTIKTETETKADGTVVTTSTNTQTGTVTVTSRQKDGSQTVTETKKDGSVTTSAKMADGTTAVTTSPASGKITSEVNLSSNAVSAAKGKAVSLPIPSVEAAFASFANAPEIKVDAAGSDTVKIEIPVKNETASTVAVLIQADGSEQIVKNTARSDSGLILAVTPGATIKIIDNAKTFGDVKPMHWAHDAVAFSASRELFTGTSDATFTPDASMTRAMLFTVLARLDGQDTSTGSTWYEVPVGWAVQKDISDGTNLNGNITREQLMTILYRYAGSPSTNADLSAFTDNGTVSDYARNAVEWGVSIGLMNGTDENTLEPKGFATRAEVATLLMRFIER